MKYHQRSFSVQNAGVVTCALSVVVGNHALTTEQDASVNEVNGFINSSHNTKLVQGRSREENLTLTSSLVFVIFNNH